MHLRVVRCVVLGSLLARSGGGKDGELTSPVAPSPVLTTVAVALSASSIAVGARRPSGGARAGDDRAVSSKARRPTPIEIPIADRGRLESIGKVAPWQRVVVFGSHVKHSENFQLRTTTSLSLRKA